MYLVQSVDGTEGLKRLKALGYRKKKEQIQKSGVEDA